MFSGISLMATGLGLCITPRTFPSSIDTEMADPYGDCLRLLCCLWLFQAATTRPRTRIIYAQAPPAAPYPGTQPVYYGASGGDLPLLACVTMDRSEPTDRV